MYLCVICLQIYQSKNLHQLYHISDYALRMYNYLTYLYEPERAKIWVRSNADSNNINPLQTLG